MTSNTFDIGLNDDLAIFTNDSEDVFNTGPSFLLNQGPDINMSDIGQTENLVSDIILDMPNESKIDFMRNQPKNQKHRSESFSSIGSISSVSSGATIEAEPIKSRPKNVHEPIRTKNQPKYPTQQPVDIIHRSFKQSIPEKKITQEAKYVTPNAFPPRQNQESIPDINFNFDDLLDTKKLKHSDNNSVNGDSQSTIRNDQNFSNMDKKIQYEPQQTFQEPQQTFQEPQQTFQEPQQTFQEPPKYANEKDEKRDLLLKLQALEKRRGITLSSTYNMNSTLDDIKMEYNSQSSILETEASIAFMRKGLIFCTSGMEYVNRRYDPIGAKLDGWGENVMENIMDYDGIFERLHHKYSGSVKMEPEMELLFALGGSAFMFHLSHALFKTAMPQFGNVLRENPDLMKGIFNAASEASKRSTGRSPMPSNGENPQMQSPGIDFSSILGQMGIGGGGSGGADISGLSNFMNSISNPPPKPQSGRNSKDPEVTEMFRKMVEVDQQADNVSVSSVESNRSLGSNGMKKAVISPLQNKRGSTGGNVIKF